MANFSSMYIAATGMLALGTGMQTISNNLANVNTVGFKAMRTNYEDLISECYISGSNHNQVGRGAKVSTIQSMFTQGAFMNAQQDTDLAIAGDGFFNVRHNQTGEIRYTRAGQFTFRKDGYMEDPSNNILQGWQMSIPKAGETPRRLGNPVDIKITLLDAPPVATAEVRSVSNLNADDQSAYPYPAYAQAEEYAKTTAVAQARTQAQTQVETQAVAQAEALAETARLASAQAVWNPAAGGGTGTDTPIAAASGGGLTPSANEEYNKQFIEKYNARFNVNYAPADLAGMRVVADASAANPSAGVMSEADFQALTTDTTRTMVNMAAAAGQSAYDSAYKPAYQSAYESVYDSTYKSVYDSTYAAVYKETYDQAVAGMSGWQWEGDGYAGAWDARKKPPMDPASSTHSEPLTVYDSLGNEHDLMIYYQKNPHMENVWDYIVTADPGEDARSGNGGRSFSATEASFAGLIQKGKITFSADDDPSRHGGLVKSMEAQNLDLSKSLLAAVDQPVTAGASPGLSTASIGGYYTGSPGIDPATGQFVSDDRTYTLTFGYQNSDGTWSANTPTSPPMSAVTWRDDAGNVGHFPISEKSYPGPYEFGSGLTVTFGSGNSPLNFGAVGGAPITVTAHSEQMVWTEARPNGDGHFDLNLTFVDTSRATAGPPYPAGSPTVTQTVALDLGARAGGAGGTWIPDEVGTTQYASQSNTVAKEQDGFPESALRRLYVREDGMVMGVYGEKREEALYQICLTRFLNPWGLDKKGDNLFAESRFSGEGVTLAPGEGGAGTVLGNFLEQSNVDTATEIVGMIMTQRGFQANSKAITTSDTMLATAIQLKK